jgi:hypothetical protein
MVNVGFGESTVNRVVCVALTPEPALVVVSDADDWPPHPVTIPVKSPRHTIRKPSAHFI